MSKVRFPATEMAVRDWLRTRPSLLELLSNDSRRIDVEPHPSAACIAVHRVAGRSVRNLPIDYASLSWHCWSPAGTGASRMTAQRLSVALQGEIESLQSPTPFNADTIGLAGEWLGSYYSPGQGDRHRYVVNGNIAARLTQEALLAAT